MIYDKTATLSPVDVLKDEVAVDAPDTALELSVYDASGRRMLSYRAAEKKIEEIPDPARPAKHEPGPGANVSGQGRRGL